MHLQPEGTWKENEEIEKRNWIYYCSEEVVVQRGDAFDSHAGPSVAHGAYAWSHWEDDSGWREEGRGKGISSSTTTEKRRQIEVTSHK